MVQTLLMVLVILIDASHYWLGFRLSHVLCRDEAAMDLEDFLETEVAAAVAATAVIFSPRVRKVLRRGLVYTVAGGLIVGEVATSAARGVGRGVQQGMTSARRFAQESDGQKGNGAGEVQHE
jgi:hypothetical protein